MMGVLLIACAAALATFVLFVLATVLADLVYVRNRVPLTVLVAPALVAWAAGAPGIALGWLVLAAAVTAQRDTEADRFGLVTSLLLLTTFSLAWLRPPGAAFLSPASALAFAAGTAVSVLLLRRVEIEPVPRADQAGVLALVLLVAIAPALR